MKSADIQDKYTLEYYLTYNDGWEEWEDFDGSCTTGRFQTNIKLLQLFRDDALLDVGCGRGEVCIYHARQGGVATGVDYSPSALQVAKAKVQQIEKQLNRRLFVEFFSSLYELPRSLFNKILMSEVIEHMDELEATFWLRELWSRLSPGGRILIYTTPNTLTKIGDWLLFWKRRDKHVVPPHHINELNYFRLRRIADRAGLENVRISYGETEGVPRWIVRNSLRHLFCSGLTLVAEKR